MAWWKNTSLWLTVAEFVANLLKSKAKDEKPE